MSRKFDFSNSEADRAAKLNEMMNILVDKGGAPREIAERAINTAFDAIESALKVLGEKTESVNDSTFTRAIVEGTITWLLDQYVKGTEDDTRLAMKGLITEPGS